MNSTQGRKMETQILEDSPGIRHHPQGPEVVVAPRNTQTDNKPNKVGWGQDYFKALLRGADGLVGYLGILGSAGAYQQHSTVVWLIEHVYINNLYLQPQQVSY